MKKLDKGSLNQLENSMNQHFSSNNKIYLFMDEYGRCGKAFTGNETHIMVQKAITTSDGRIELKKDEIEIPKGMKCEYKKGPNIDDMEQEWVIFNNTNNGSRKIYEDEVNFFKKLADATEVEWALASNSKTGGGKLFTTFSPTGADVSPAFSGGYDTLMHNHTGRIHDASTGDQYQLNYKDSGIWHLLKSRYDDYRDFIIYSEEENDFAYY